MLDLIKNSIAHNKTIYFKYLRNLSFQSKISSDNTHNVLFGNDLDILKFFEKNDKKFNMIYFSLEDFKMIYNLDSKDLLSDTVQDWLKKLYMLARECLTKDGVFIVHAKDKSSLKVRENLTDIFGFDNYITSFIWDNLFKSSNFVNTVATSNEFFYVFSKNKSNLNVNKIMYNPNKNSEYPFSDSFISTRGKYKRVPLDKNEIGLNNYSKPVYLDREMFFPSGSESKFIKSKNWSWIFPTNEIVDLFEKGFIEIERKSKNISRLYLKEYENLDSKVSKGSKSKNINNFILNASNKSDKLMIEKLTNSENIKNLVPKNVLSALFQTFLGENDNVLQLSTCFSLGVPLVAYNNMVNSSKSSFTLIHPVAENFDLDYNTSISDLAKVHNKDSKNTNQLISNLIYLYNVMYKYSNRGKEGIDSIIYNINVFNSNFSDGYLPVDFLDFTEMKSKLVPTIISDYNVLYPNCKCEDISKNVDFDIISKDFGEFVLILNFEMFATEQILNNLKVLSADKKHIIYSFTSFIEDMITKKSNLLFSDFEDYFKNI